MRQADVDNDTVYNSEEVVNDTFYNSEEVDDDIVYNSNEIVDVDSSDTSDASKGVADVYDDNDEDAAIGVNR